MKNEKIADALNAIQPSDEAKNRVFGKVLQRREKSRRTHKKAVAFAATAAAFCLMVFGGRLLPAQSGNAFTLKAYAIEQQADGTTTLREVDLLDDTQFWSYHFDGEEFYLNVNLKCEGANIKSVDFFADEGFFAKQYLPTEPGEVTVHVSSVPTAGRTDSDGVTTITLYGYSFEKIGNKLTLNKDEVTSGMLFFLGQEIQVTDWSRVHEQLPTQMRIRAVATFDDGTTQEKTHTLDLAKEKDSIGTFVRPPEEMERLRIKSENYHSLLYSIPLDQCEVMPDSVQTLRYGDTFEYSWESVDGGAGTAYPVTEESIDSAFSEGLFDETGVFIVGSSLNSDGSDGYIAVIEQNVDGSFTGKVYKAPAQLITDWMGWG